MGKVVDEMSTVISDLMNDDEKIVVPTLAEMIEFLKKQSVNMRLFNCVPIGTAALVCLECSPDGLGYTLYASADGEDIECVSEAYTAWDEIYLSDSNAELRAIAHRLISTVRDALTTRIQR